MAVTRGELSRTARPPRRIVELPPDAAAAGAGRRGYQVLFAGAVSTLSPEHRRLLGLPPAGLRVPRAATTALLAHPARRARRGPARRGRGWRGAGSGAPPTPPERCPPRSYDRRVTTLPLTPDELLTTTRAVRKRLDLTRAGTHGADPGVPRDRAAGAVGLEPAGLAVGGGARRGAACGDRRCLPAAVRDYLASPGAAGRLYADDPERAPVQQRVGDSVGLPRRAPGPGAGARHPVPAGRAACPRPTRPGCGGRLLPAAWSFMLAARARGPGHRVDDAAPGLRGRGGRRCSGCRTTSEQAALIPTAYYTGEDLRPGPRGPLDEVLHLDRW